MRAFWSVKGAGGGGLKVPTERCRSLDTPILELIKEIVFHLQIKFETSLRLLRLIVWPQEVLEVTEVKMKKI